MNIPVGQYLTLLSRYLRPQRSRLLLLSLLLTSSIALQLLGPQVLRAFIDGAMANTARAELIRLALLFIGVALVNQFMAAFARYVSENVGWTATNGLRNDLVAHCLSLDLSFHKARTPGELIERIDGDVTALSHFFSQFVIQLLSNLLLLLGVILLLFREDWRAGIALTLFALFALLLLSRVRNLAVPHMRAGREQSARVFGFLGERLGGTEEIRAAGAVPHTLNRFYQLLREWLPLNLRSALYGFTTLWSTTIFTFALGYALAFGLGAWLWRAGAITIGTVYLIFNYTELLRRPIEQIRTQMQELQQATASIGRVQELISVTTSLPDGPGTPIPAGPLPIQFDNLTFGYEAEESRVLRSIDLQIRPGRVVGLLGRTGSGKTTMARLLLRLYDPTEGAVRLGGVDLRQAKLQQLRRRVSLVSQDVQLFAASLRDNLTFFDPAVSDARITAALDQVGMGSWLRSLPQGLDTCLEANGGGLSAGEAQLLALTRVFLADPGLVILDEASSRLDPATEHLIERALDQLLKDRTGIIIAHRLATIQRADQILLLEEGQVLEYGDREALAADPHSRFHQLLQVGLEEVLA